jgi:hypothetical protein
MPDIVSDFEQFRNKATNIVDDFEKFKSKPVAPTTSIADDFEKFKASVPVAAAPTISEPTAEEIAAAQKPAIITRRPSPNPQKIEEARVEQAKNKIPFNDVINKPEYYNTVLDYAKARFGKEGEVKAGESKEDYIGRFMTHMRFLKSGNEINSMGELQYLNNALANKKNDDVLKAGKAYDLFEKIADASTFSNKPSQGQQGFAPVMDYFASAVSSPSTLASIFTGNIALGKLGTMAEQAGIKAAVKTAKGAALAAAVPAAEFTAGANNSVVEQKINLNVAQAKINEGKQKLLDPNLDPELRDEIQKGIDEAEAQVKQGVSVTKAAVSGLVNSVVGSVELVPVLRGKVTGKSKGYTLDEATQPYKKNTPPTVDVKPVKDPTEKALEDQFDIFEGRKLLDKQGNPTTAAQMQVRTDLNQKATLIAQDIWKQQPDLAIKPNEKVSDAIKRTLESVDTIDDLTFERALTNAGVTTDEFAKMFRTSAGDAGRTLQSLSVVARIQNKLKAIDPIAATEIDAMYGRNKAIPSALSGVWDFVLRADRERKALMVSQLSTTIHNGFSGLAVVSIDSAKEMLESTLYRTGKSLYELGTGQQVTGTFTGGLKGIYDDTVRTAFYLGQNNLSSQVTEALLKGTPSLYNRLIKQTGDIGVDKLSKAPTDLIVGYGDVKLNLSTASRVLNTLNTAQDAFFRQAVFTSTVEKQLSRGGLNMFQVIGEGKAVPDDILKNAVDAALSATFSKTPTNGLGWAFVKGAEMMGPVASVFVPFPRFVVNAVEWQLKYSPIGLMNGAADLAVGATRKMAGDADEVATQQLMRGNEALSKGVVGTALLYGAIKYREANQDTSWFETKQPDGSSIDIRAFSPAGPFLAAADFYVKWKQGRTEEFKTKDFIEGFAGMKALNGTSLLIADKVMQSTTDSGTGETASNDFVNNFMARLVAGYFTSYTTPLKQIDDLVTSIDRNSTLPRDAYQIPKGEESFGESFKKEFTKGMPAFLGKVGLPSKTDLPVYQPALTREAAFNESGPLKVLAGISLKGKPSDLEEEVTKLKIPFNKVFTSTGDRIVDDEARRIMAPFIIEQFNNLKNAPYYKDASQDLKKINLQNLLNFAETTAKEIATNKDEAAAYAKGEQPRLYEVKYSKLAPELKRVVVEQYRNNTGKDLETTKDYATALAFAEAFKNYPGYAVGGLVQNFSEGGLLTKKILGGLVDTGLTKATANLTKALEKAGASQVAAPAIEQTAQALATPVVKEGAAPALAKAPSIKSKASPAVSQPKPVDLEMEKLVSDAEASFTPPPKVEPEVVPEIKTDLPMEAPVPMSPYMKKLSEGDLNGNKYGFSRDSDIISDFEVRQNTLTALKQIRTDAFDKLIEMPNVAGKIEDDVIAVAQGEYRAAKGKEVDINDPKSVEDFVSFSMPLQDKLNKLREQYKDRPPKVLYHGTPYNAEERATKGFFDPQTLPEDQAGQRELKVGATSFTSDARFNYANSSFGGTNPENIVQTTIPYADYEFRRINMSRDQYKKKVGVEDMGDMNTIARSITGSPTVARPLGLPRSIGMKESEDAFTESEKLAISRNMYETEKKTPLFNQQEDIFNNSLDRLQELKRSFLSPESLKPIKEGGLGSEEVQALKAYRLIRGIVRNEFRETGGKAAMEAGYTPITSSNQSTASRLGRLARPSLVRNFDLGKFIPDVISTLEKVGSKDKAEALRVLEQQFNVLRKSTVDSSSPNAEMSAAVKGETKAVDAIRDLVGGDYRNKENKKRIGLAKGGLASRR